MNDMYLHYFDMKKTVWKPELGIRYFLPYSLIAIPLLQCTILLLLLFWILQYANLYSLLPLTSLMGFIVVDFLNFI
jgi:hypothetical protein